MTHVLQSLDELALGTLDTAEAAAVEAHLARCPACATSAAEANEALASLAFALAPIAPSPSVRARLLASAAGANTKGRFERFVTAVAKLFDVTTEKARSLVDAIDVPEAWDAGPVPGVGFLHLNGGPRVAIADCGLVRFPKGMEWPLHRHVGHESMLILEGGLVEDGVVFGPGSLIEKAPGTQHAFTLLPDVDCVCGVVLFEGIEMPPGTRLAL